MIAFHACLFQCHKLLFAQQSMRGAKGQLLTILLNGTVCFHCLVKILTQTAAGRYDGIAVYALGLVILGVLHNFFYRKKSVFRNTGTMMSRLSTELTVFTAFTTAAVNNRTQVYFFAT